MVTMRVAMMPREYPPEVYGGAGVHVTELVARLRALCDVDVYCMGVPRPGEEGVFVQSPDPALADANTALSMLSTDLRMAHAAAGADVVHSHTWYTGLAGHVAAQLYGVPHVLTAHSLEPRRPWKAEQLGGGYRLSSWAEKTAYEAADAIISVSTGMRGGILESYPALDPAKVHVIRNGIDTDIYRSTDERSLLTDKGVDLDAPGGAIELHNFYVPAGGDVPDREANPKFAHKLDFVAEATAWNAARGASKRSVLVGDLNIAPLQTDVWSHKALLKVVSHTPVEVEAFGRVQAAGGWVDAMRRRVPPSEKLYTW